MLFFLRTGYRVDRARPAGPRPVDPGRPTATTWTTTPTIWPPSSSTSTCTTPSTSGTRPAAARSRTTWRRHGESRAAKAALISAVPPLMVKTDANPEGLPKAVFDDLQAQLAANRSQFYRDLPAGPFYGFNRPGVESSEAIIANWWRQGMMGGAKAHYDGIVAFSQTDFTEDLKKITIPVLVMHSEDDQIVPYVAAGPKSAELLQNGILKTYKDFPHGMPTTHADVINADLLEFLQS